MKAICVSWLEAVMNSWQKVSKYLLNKNQKDDEPQKYHMEFDIPHLVEWRIPKLQFRIKLRIGNSERKIMSLLVLDRCRIKITVNLADLDSKQIFKDKKKSGIIKDFCKELVIRKTNKGNVIVLVRNSDQTNWKRYYPDKVIINTKIFRTTQ